MPFHRAVTIPTDPTCTASRHVSLSAYHAGCRCPEAVAAREHQRTWSKAHDAARWAALVEAKASARRAPAGEVVDLSDADPVVVERVLTKQLPFSAVRHHADRVAVVELLARTSSFDKITRTLHISDETALKLVRLAEASRAQVAA